MPGGEDWNVGDDDFGADITVAEDSSFWIIRHVCFRRRFGRPAAACAASWPSSRPRGCRATNGTVIVAGSAFAAGTWGTDEYLSVTRLTAGGLPDTTFGTGGRATVLLAAAEQADQPESLAVALTVKAVSVEAGGGVFVAGDDARSVPFAVRFRSIGTATLTLRGGTYADTLANALAFPFHPTAYAVAADGGLIVAGYISGRGGVFIATVAKLTPTGGLDTAFGSGGKVELLAKVNPSGVAVQADGKVLVGGRGAFDASVYLVRLTAAGAADPTFGVGGYAVNAPDPDATAAAVSADAVRRLYPTHDANHNVTALTDAAGAVVERYAYDPYGAVTVLNLDGTARVDGASYSQYAWANLHQGLRLDVVTGTYDSRNRVYSVVLGRWLQPDPSGYADGSVFIRVC